MVEQCKACKGNGLCCTDEEIKKIMARDAETGYQTAIQKCPTCKGDGYIYSVSE